MTSIAEEIVRLAEQYPLSDVHIRVNERIFGRVDGEIVPMTDRKPSSSEIDSFVQQFLSDEQQRRFLEIGDQDFGVAISGHRFRASLLRSLAGLVVVLRKIDSVIPTPEKLDLPSVVRNIATRPNGLVLFTGATGAGKSTSLAALIDQINGAKKAHILTIEDPIEYVHSNKECIVTQREVGRDTPSFIQALRAALREDPDVILIGEMRDQETIQLAITAAETGHLVFATLHTSGAANSINRIIDVFPPQQQTQVRAQLSQSLHMVVTQRLFKRTDGRGRVAAFEVMIANSAVRNLVREGKVFQIESVMQTSRGEGMVTMDAAIGELIASGRIPPQDRA